MPVVDGDAAGVRPATRRRTPAPVTRGQQPLTRDQDRHRRAWCQGTMPAERTEAAAAPVSGQVEPRVVQPEPAPEQQHQRVGRPADLGGRGSGMRSGAVAGQDKAIMTVRPDRQRPSTAGPPAPVAPAEERTWSRPRLHRRRPARSDSRHPGRGPLRGPSGASPPRGPVGGTRRTPYAGAARRSSTRCRARWPAEWPAGWLRCRAYQALSAVRSSAGGDGSGASGRPTRTACSAQRCVSTRGAPPGRSPSSPGRTVPARAGRPRRAVRTTSATSSSSWASTVSRRDHRARCTRASSHTGSSDS